VFVKVIGAMKRGGIEIKAILGRDISLIVPLIGPRHALRAHHGASAARLTP